MATWPKDANGNYLDRTAAINFISVTGVSKRPSAPRSVLAQSGARKVLVTWELPVVHSDIVAWKVYTGTERALLATIKDPNVRQYTVTATAGSSPPDVNVFVSSVNRQGIESPKMQVTKAATTEAGAPSDPSPPAGSASSGDTGITGDFNSGFISGGGNVGNL